MVPQAYEAWLDRQLGRQVVKADIGRKHAKMGASPFVFLRGTCHLFYERLPEVQMRVKAPVVWCCGDLHLEILRRLAIDGDADINNPWRPLNGCGRMRDAQSIAFFR